MVYFSSALKKRTIALNMRAYGLSDVLFGRGRGALLGLLYGHPDESFYYREITRRLSAFSVGTLQRELATLSRLGLLVRTAKGNQVHYRANVEHPAYSELRALVAKTIGHNAVLRSALTPLADRIKVAFVYGSVARGDEGAASDVDLMVVGEATLEEVVQHLGEAENALGRPINPTIYGVPEFRSKLTAGNHFLSAVMRGEKVFIIGDEDELGKLREKQLDRRRTNKR